MWGDIFIHFIDVCGENVATPPKYEKGGKVTKNSTYILPTNVNILAYFCLVLHASLRIMLNVYFCIFIFF